jgi:translocation and assembly module TamB
MRKAVWIKYTLLPVLGLLCLACLLLVFTQTRIFKNLLRDYIEDRSGEYINADLRIGRIDGNLFTDLKISNVVIEDRNDTLVYINTIITRYRPWRLLRGEIYIDSMLIGQPYIYVNQTSDSTYNLGGLFKRSAAEETDTVKTGATEPPGISLVLDDFNLKNARIKIDAVDSVIPELVYDLNVRLKAKYNAEVQTLNLRDFRLKTVDPDFSLNELTFTVKRENEEISLRDLVIRTAHNRIDADGTYRFPDSLKSYGNISAAPIEFSELTAVFPDLTFRGHPAIDIDLSYVLDSLEVKLELTEGEQRMFIDANIIGLKDMIRQTPGEQCRYYLKGQVQNLNPSRWIDDPRLDHTINGAFNISGSGISPEEARVVFSSTLDGCIFWGRPISSASLNADYDRGDLKIRNKTDSEFGNLLLNAQVIGINSIQKYNASMNIEELNIAPLLSNDSLQTDLNLSLIARGAGFDPENMKGVLTLNLLPSSIKGIGPVRQFGFDSLYSRIIYHGENYKIDTLLFQSRPLYAALKGEINPAGENHLQFKTRLNDNPLWKDLIGAEQFRIDGSVEGTADGKLDSLRINAGLNFGNIVFDSVRVDSAVCMIDAMRVKDILSGDIDLHIADIFAFGIGADSVNLASRFYDRSADIVLDVTRQDDIGFHIETGVTADSVIRATIPKMTVDIKGRRWEGGSPDSEIRIAGDSYYIKDFVLASDSDSSGINRFIRVDGVFSMAGEENLDIRISSLNIGELAALLKPGLDVSGDFSLDAKFNGTAEKLDIGADWKIVDGRINQYSFRSVRGLIGYRNTTLNGNIALLPTSTDSLVIRCSLPMNLSLTDRDTILFPDNRFEIKIKSEGVPLTILKASGVKIENVDGLLSCDIDIGNTINEPDIEGNLSLDNGAFRIPEYGIDYTGFTLNSSFNNREISLDRLDIKRDKGYVRASGAARFKDNFTADELENFFLDIKTHKFYIVKRPNYDLQVSSDIHLKGDTHNPKFGGHINILRSSVYLPAVMGKNGKTAEESIEPVPMLVEASEQPVDTADTTKTAMIKSDSTDEEPSESRVYTNIYRNLQGDIKISIPKNTWIKSPQMRMEISGDLDVVKNGPDPELFGNIRVVRGYYDLYGRRFNLKDGQLFFEGGAEFNPRILLEAEYVFRTPAREKKHLNLQVSGRVMSPEFSFNLDGVNISEGDAVSYIIFGRSLDELTYGQRTDMKQNTGGLSSEADLARGLAGKVLSDQLSRTLGKELGLDIIEINAEDNWQGASFVAGKYLTNDLFLSFQKGFGEIQDNEFAQETVTLEYEFIKNLFLQLIEGNSKTSGFDFIFKFDW